MASSPIVTGSPVAATTSTSRGSGCAWISQASASRRLVSPAIAEGTTTSWCPAACHFATRRATLRIRSSEPTEVPPNFWTISAIPAPGKRWILQDAVEPETEAKRFHGTIAPLVWRIHETQIRRCAGAGNHCRAAHAGTGQRGRQQQGQLRLIVAQGRDLPRQAARPGLPGRAPQVEAQGGDLPSLQDAIEPEQGKQRRYHHQDGAGGGEQRRHFGFLRF